MSESAQSHLPACRRCRGRKVRCDRLTPHCSSCRRAAQRCDFVDDGSGEILSREEITQLEKREVELRSLFDANDEAQHNEADHRTRTASRDGTGRQRTPYGSEDAFVGDASGSSFLATMLSSPRYSQIKDSLLEQLRERTAVRSPNAQPARLPTALEARYYMQTYLSGSHLHHPFLRESDIMGLLENVYAAQDGIGPSSQDLYRLYMICAVAAVSLKREMIATEPPYNFFISARSFLGQISLLGTKDSILNLLLLARFGIYHHIGSSIWEIVRICMRTCVELEFHLPPRDPLPPLIEQHQRCIFWECYIVDRYSSVTLGRPFAIADESIKIDLPVQLADHDIARLHTCRLDESDRLHLAPNNIAVFIFVVRLRQITSQIKKSFFSGPEQNLNRRQHQHSLSNAGDIYAELYRLIDALEQWRSTGPIFQYSSSLYQRSEWYDFLYEKERLWLVRGAISALSNTGSTPHHLIDMCAKSAIQVILLYKNMFASKVINSTRGYFQMLFTAGLSLIYCRSLEHETKAHDDTEGDVTSSLDACSEVLMHLSDSLVDARPYAYVFRHIKDNFFTELFKNRQNQAILSTIIPDPVPQALNPFPLDWVQSSTRTVDLHQEFPHDPTLPPIPVHDETFFSSDWLLPTWSPSASRFVAGMEADVNEYAFGDWSLPDLHGAGPALQQ